ncbi:unnamed protein product [Enterobius vermicularis]|uniref:Uncharacterized protein n=1 Tax=Enterobius vermicularis TaxID=51028 RepID=A0A0N4VC71_ENTVE|nr:unnamed protein product [Enterobius vermicularis]
MGNADCNTYLQIPDDIDLKRLLVINTHIGLFQYNRPPFVINSALAVFQPIISQMIFGIPKVSILATSSIDEPWVSSSGYLDVGNLDSLLYLYTLHKYFANSL